MENAKSVRGFQEIKNKILGTNNFGAFRQYLISVLDALAAMDPSQREAYAKNVQFVTQIQNFLIVQRKTLFLSF